MRQSRLLIMLLSLMLVQANISAGEQEAVEETGKVSLSLSDCLNTALANNIDIKIAKIDSALKKEDIRLADSMFDATLTGLLAFENDERRQPNVIMGTQDVKAYYDFGVSKKIFTGTELSIDYSDTRSSSDSAFVTINPQHEAEVSFGMRQPLVKNILGYIDRRTVRLSRIEARIAGIEALEAIETKLAETIKAYWKLVFEYQNVALMEEIYEQAKGLHETFQRHLATGYVEQTAVYEVEANMRARAAELEIAKNRLLNANNNLKLLMNEVGDYIIVPTAKLETLKENANLAESLNEAFIANRQYRVKKQNLRARKVDLEMKENALWPEIDLVGTYALNGIDRKSLKANRQITSEDNSYYYGGIEMKIPVENNDARAEFNKAKLNKHKAILEIIHVEKKILTFIDDAVRNVNLHLENSAKWTTIKNIQYKKFREEEKKLRYGRTTSKIVVDYQRDFLQAALSEHVAILDYYVSLVDLENAKDTLLNRVGIFTYEDI